MNYFDMIATINIDIAQQIADGTSFDNLLIVGPTPKVAPVNALPAVSVYADLSEVEAAGYVTSGDAADPIGVAAKVAFSQNPKPNAVYIAPMRGEESALDAIKRAVATPGWWAVCPAGVDEDEYEAIAAYIETQEKVFCYTELGFFDTDTPAAAVSQEAGYYRTIGIFGKESSGQEDDEIPEANRYMNVAFVAKWFNYQSGTETTAYKVLNGVHTAELTAEEMSALDKAHINYFVPVGNRNLTMGGAVLAGEWMDVVRFRDWLKNDMQNRVVDLFATNSKIPFTDAGIAAIQNQMLASLKAGQDIGGIAEEEFGPNGESIPGYVTSVPSAASITASQKSSRKLTGLTFKARLASAVHLTDLDGTLTYEL